MRNLFLVGLGGFLGSIARYSLSGLVMRATTATRFPIATLVVNVVGCLVMAMLTGLAERWHLLGSSARLFLLTGFLGGFTTYSAFAYETYFLEGNTPGRRPWRTSPPCNGGARRVVGGASAGGAVDVVVFAIRLHCGI